MKPASNHLSKLIALLLIPILLGIGGCEKETYVYDINPDSIIPASANKDKLKTPEQYIAILHVNLFQRPLSANEIYDISRVIQSIGDKTLAHEVIISNFMNKPDVILPSNEEMRADIGSFIAETYERFFLRLPGELEKEHFIRYIQNHPNLTPELVYFAFAIANEYQFY